MCNCLAVRSVAATVLCLASVLVAQVALAQVPPGVTRDAQPSGRAVLGAIEDVLASAIEKTQASVVSIARVRKGDQPNLVGAFGASGSGPGELDFIPNEYGTGVVVDRRGLILTNFHVLGDRKDSEFYVTTIDRQRFPAAIKAADERIDLAVLEIIGTTNLKPIEFGDAKTLRKGHFVISLGNPYAIARDGQVSASIGHVANLARKAAPIPSSDPNSRTGLKPTLHHFGTLIQTDAKLNLGTSGGPLLNLDGKMVGLTTALAAIAGYEQAAGFAIPVDETFRYAVERLKEGREVQYSFLGVSPDSNTPFRGPRRGVAINKVVAGTPADTLLDARDVITKIDGQPIFDADGLMLHIGKLPVESTARLTIERNGVEQRPVPVRLAKYPPIHRQIITNPEPLWRGMQIDFATGVLSLEQNVIEMFSAVLREGCIGVREVVKDSPAWKAGLRPGMLITQAGAHRVRTPAEFHDRVAGAEGTVSLIAWSSGLSKATYEVEAER